MRAFALLLALLAAPALAQDTIVADLSRKQVAIDTTFTGSEILIFGAARRDAPAPDSPLGVVVTVAGPSEPITVRKKD
ncbi:MAG: TIGR02186 family protein, partial [Shimia sp.]